MTQPQLNPEDMGQLTTGMVALHEVFISAVNAGFTEHQALFIVVQMLLSSQQHPPTP